MERTNEDYIKKLMRDLKKIDYIRPDEIPNIDLYMDQVTTFMDEHLSSSKRYDDDKLLTKTMINNYTKNNLLPPPNKKKYSKEHMLLLIFVYYFKNILSISDIQNIFSPLTASFYNEKEPVNLEYIYREVFSLEREQIELLTKDVIKKYTRSKNTFTEPECEKDREFLQTFSFICMLSFDVYVKKMIIERLIDQSISERKAAQKQTDSKKTESKKSEEKKE